MQRAFLFLLLLILNIAVSNRALRGEGCKERGEERRGVFAVLKVYY